MTTPYLQMEVIKTFDGHVLAGSGRIADMRAIIRSWLWTEAGRLRTPWRLLVFGFLLLVVSLAVGGAALAAGYATDPADAGGVDLAVALCFLTVNGVLTALLTLLSGRYLDRRLLGDLGLRGGTRPRLDLLSGAGLGVVLVCGAYAVGAALGVYEGSVDPSGPPEYPLAFWLALLVVNMVVVGVYEELLLRGYVLTNFAEGLAALLGHRASVAAALVVSSLGFGLLHGANPAASGRSLVTVTLAGLLLGLAYVYTGSLSFPVGLHVTWNLSGVLLGLPVSGLEIPVRLVRTEVTGDPAVHGGGFGIEGGLLGLGATVLGCLAVVGYARLTGRTFRTEIATPALRS